MGPSLLVVPELMGWETQWDQLVDAAPIPSPFLRSWWLTGTGGSPSRYLLLVDDERLVGGLALEEHSRFGLRCLRLPSSGPLCPDHFDLVVSPGELPAITGLLRGWLGGSGAKLIDLEGVPANSQLVAVLPPPVNSRLFAVAPWAPLPATAEEYLAQLPSHFRRQMRRASTRLSAEGIVYRAHRGLSILPALETLRRLHYGQWGERSRFLSQFDRFAAASRLAAEVDEVVVHELACDDFVVAAVVTFEVASRMSLYQSGRLTHPRWREAMSVLLTSAISVACDSGLIEVDFLRGDEPYKYRFAPRERKLFRLLAAHGPRGQAARSVKAAASTTKEIAERMTRVGRRVMT
jgi:CelD/BcsL family acetyltransferase involved in cellulose biosynthesis